MRENEEHLKGLNEGMIEENEMNDKEMFCYWNEQVMTDLNDAALLEMH